MKVKEAKELFKDIFEDVDDDGDIIFKVGGTKNLNITIEKLRIEVTKDNKELDTIIVNVKD